MFPDNICQNIDILVVINVQKNIFGFHSNQKTQGQKHQVNDLYFKYQVCQMILRHLNTFLQFRLSFHKPRCRSPSNAVFLLKVQHIPHSSGETNEKSPCFEFQRTLNLTNHSVLKGNAHKLWYQSRIANVNTQ